MRCNVVGSKYQIVENQNSFAIDLRLYGALRLFPAV